MCRPHAAFDNEALQETPLLASDQRAGHGDDRARGRGARARRDNNYELAPRPKCLFGGSDHVGVRGLDSSGLEPRADASRPKGSTLGE